VLQNTGPKLPNAGPVQSTGPELQSTGPARGAGPEPENAGPVLQNAGPELSTCIELGAGVSVEPVQHGTSSQDSQSARPVYVNNVQLDYGDTLTETATKQPVTTTDSQTGLALVTNEVLSEQQTRDRIITVVCSWLENPDTVPDDNPPEILVHDQGGEFWSDVMKRLATLLEIQPTKITSHRPNSNGVVERVHATLHNMFAKMVERQQRNWCELTPYLTYAYNTASHSSSTFSPFYLMFLRHPRMPIELQIKRPTEAAFQTDDKYVSLAGERMRTAYEIVREQLRATFNQAKRRYDNRVKTATFQEGQFVWYYIPRTRKRHEQKVGVE